MHVEIYHQCLSDCTISLQDFQGDCDVIEDTKAGTVRPPGVVAAARRVTGKAVLQSQIAGQNRAPSRTPGPQRNVSPQGKAYFPGDFCRYIRIKNLIDIDRIMRECDPLEWRGTRTIKAAITEKSFHPDKFGDSAELVHRKPVVCRKVGTIGGVMHDRKCHWFEYRQNRLSEKPHDHHALARP